MRNPSALVSARAARGPAWAAVESDDVAVWAGSRMLIFGLTNGALDPAANRWRWLPAMQYPRSEFAAVWTGRQVLIWGGLTAASIPPPHGEAYTPATGKWTAMPASPLRGRADPAAACTGRQMIIWGGRSGSTFMANGAAFTPAK